MDSFTKKVCVSCMVTILFTSITFILICYFGEASWWGSDKSSLLGKTRTSGDYCETFNSHLFLHERMNSISNLAFIIFGEIIIFCVFFDSYKASTTEKNTELESRHSPIAQDVETSNLNETPIVDALVKNDNGHGIYIDSIWLYLYGIFVIWIGITSFMFHASYKKYAQHLDVTAIYFLEFTFLLLVLNIFIQSIYINKLGNGKTKFKFQLSLLLILIDVILSILTIIFKLSEIVIIIIVIGSLFLCSILLVLWMILFIKSKKLMNNKKFEKKFFICAIISFVLLVGGFSIRQLDSTVCYPNSIFQIHALFHVIIATGVACAFQIFRTINQYTNEPDNNDQHSANNSVQMV